MTIKDLRNVNSTDDKDVVKLIDTLYEETMSANLKQHRDWYINERFVRGDHWIAYNKTLNRIQILPLNDGEVRRTVNKIRSQVRSVKNFVKRNQPRWEVHPMDVTDESYDEAKKYNKLVQNIYDTRNFPDLLTGIIVNALKYSVGILEGGMIAKLGKNYLDFWVDDTFDILFDPASPTVQDCRFIIKATKKPVSTIKEFYKIKDIASDNKEAASQYKEWLENDKYNYAANKGSEDLQTAIVKELWLKWVEGDKVKIKIITTTGTKCLKVQNPSYRRYPFFIYNPEKVANAIYSDPWIKDLVSLNKSVDKTVSQIETYIQRMLGGKYLIKQGVEVSSITDNGAEKIYYKGTTPPIQQNLQPLPSAPFSFIQSMSGWIEEFGGAREASLGRVPGSLQSGKGVEALQAADAATVAEPIENLETFLKEVSEFALECISDYHLASEEIVQKGQKIKYIGKVENPPENTLVVEPRQITVKIVPEVSYTEESKRDWIMRLAEAKLLDPQTVLEYFSFSNISDIIARVNSQKKEEFQKEMVKQKESHRSDGNAPEDTADLANQENMAMAAGQMPNMTPQALWTPEHTELHTAFIRENKDAYNQHQQMFDEHIANEQQYSENPQGGGEQPPQGGEQPPQGQPPMPMEQPQ